jgi:hypothetical protein
MNTMLQNLLQAKSNPHVFYPVLIGCLLRIGISLLYVWVPTHKDQIDQTKKMVDPLITALLSYSTLAAARSGPATPDNTTQPTQTK